MSNQEHFKFNINDFPANDNLNGLFLTQILNSSWKKKKKIIQVWSDRIMTEFSFYGTKMKLIL